MSGKIRLWPDGRVVVETDEDVTPERLELMERAIRDRTLIVLGPGWTLEHEGPPTFGIEGRPARTTDRVLDLATALFFVGIAVFMILLGLLGIASLISIVAAA